MQIGKIENTRVAMSTPGVRLSRLSMALAASFALHFALPVSAAETAPAKKDASPKISTGALGPADAQGRRAWYVEYEKGKATDVENALLSNGGKVQHRFRSAPMMSVLLPENATSTFANYLGVQRLSPVPPRRPLEQHTPWNVDAVQARDLWDADRDGAVDTGAPNGAGLVVCVIDSGLYADHDDFAGITLSGHSQVPNQAWFTDGLGHGTHVAGTVNAANNDVGVVGVLPGGAALHIVKVFNNEGDWTPTSDIAAAAEECVDAGASVVNMSLGGPYSAQEERVFQALHERGVVFVAAAGNSNGEAYTAPSFPANYRSVISVAAVDRNGDAAGFTQHPVSALNPAQQPEEGGWDAAELSAGGVQVMSTLPGPPHGRVPEYRVEAGAQSFDAQHVQGSGHGIDTAALVDGGRCLPGSDGATWADRIVLCERGDASFAEKINEVARHSGLAAVIYNHETASINPTCNDECSTQVPGIFVSQADGRALRDAWLAQNVTAVADAGACVDCTGAYGFNSGTSMASPGVAAGLALLWQACGGPENFNHRDLRFLARDSARDLEGVHPSTGIAYGPGYDRVTGWGLLQVADAAALGQQRFGATCATGLAVTPRTQTLCTLTQDHAEFDLTLTAVFEGIASFAATDVPAGATATFDPLTLPVGQRDTQFRLSDLDQAAAGRHSITLRATDAASAARTASSTAIIELANVVPVAAVLQVPADAAVDVALTPVLSWSAVDGATDYEVTIDDDADFSSPLLTTTTHATTLVPTAALPSLTQLHWRVRSANACGDAVSASASFTTGPAPGECPIGRAPRMIFEDGAETALPGWEHNGTRDSWLRYNFQAHSGSFAFWARDLSTISDQKLMSPEIALPQGSLPLTLSFWDRQAIEAERGVGCFDAALLDISVDQGQTWTPIAADKLLTVPYDGTVSDEFESPAAGLTGWCGDVRDWTQQIVDVSDYAGQTVRLRFRLATDESTGREPNGWIVDDIGVQACEVVDAVKVFGNGFE
jgi:serine protease